MINSGMKQKYTDFINVINKSDNQISNQGNQCVCGTDSDDSELKHEFEKAIRQNNNQNNNQNNIQKSRQVKQKDVSETTSSSGLGGNIEYIKKTQENFKKMNSSMNNPSQHNNPNNFVNNMNFKEEQDDNLVVKNLNSQQLKQVLQISDSKSISTIDTGSNEERIWVNKKEEILSVDSEFEHIFKDSKKKKEKENKINKKKETNTNNLEVLYEKMIAENMKKFQENEKTKVKEPKKEKIIDATTDKKDILKILCDRLDKELFYESTRGFSMENSIYKLSISKLRKNMEKFAYQENIPCSIGYMYRDFNNPKIYQNRDADKYWKRVSKNKKTILEENIDSEDKILLACIKNFKNAKKFKKKIGSSMVRAFIRTVQLVDLNDLTINIIFYVKHSEKQNN